MREFPLDSGFTDYLLFLERSVGGVLEAKPEGTLKKCHNSDIEHDTDRTDFSRILVHPCNPHNPPEHLHLSVFIRG
ncbi:MAG: hypothetical protein J5U17_02385 [Candidatus Methanoperedens sp.]|nr:hypothetical protein [Candidatus Methanoperedens sp.]MCE8428257.1 hypothetical protein [Candidatus Methanoperedens sp.]